MQHVINKLTVELACADEEQAFKSREAFLQDVYDEMISVIEMCCDQVSDADQLTQIEKLEVNLQAFKNTFFDQGRYVHLFEAAFDEALKKKVALGASSRTKEESHIDLLFHFLETGLLPWWADEKNVDLEALCEAAARRGGGEIFISRLLTYQQQAVVWQRISRQLPASFGAFVIRHIPGLQAMEAKMTALYGSVEGGAEKGPGPIRDPGRMIRAMVLEHAAEILGEKADPDKSLPARLLLKALPEVNLRLSPEAHRVVIQADPEENSFSGAPDDQSKAIPSVKEEQIKIGHAGIILLAAFLKNCLSGLKLWENDRWSSPESRSRAVYLLQYMATGGEKTFEYQLALEKIICGMPLAEPLGKSITLTAEEKKEAEDLLVAVVHHWSALKNTSMNGLRTAFLQREGLILKRNNSWLLRVERKTPDILLEQLPWGYATVSLPWNTYLIYTEW